jgi:hypothetical protein
MVRASLELDMVYGERVRAWHVYEKEWGVVKWGEGGLSVLLGGGGETDTHRWRADDQKVGGRRAREKVDGRGRR